MLFVFETPERHGIWMKNCKVALDLIWLDEQLRIVHIVPDRQPCPEEGRCPTVAPMTVASYVLEVAAGTAKREGLKPGQRIEILSEPPLP